jgi:hypothetical protein
VQEAPDIRGKRRKTDPSPEFCQPKLMTETDVETFQDRIRQMFENKNTQITPAVRLIITSIFKAYPHLGFEIYPSIEDCGLSNRDKSDNLFCSFAIEEKTLPEVLSVMIIAAKNDEKIIDDLMMKAQWFADLIDAGGQMPIHGGGALFELSQELFSHAGEYKCLEKANIPISELPDDLLSMHSFPDELYAILQPADQIIPNHCEAIKKIEAIPGLTLSAIAFAELNRAFIKEVTPSEDFLSDLLGVCKRVEEESIEPDHSYKKACLVSEEELRYYKNLQQETQQLYATSEEENRRVKSTLDSAQKAVVSGEQKYLQAIGELEKIKSHLEDAKNNPFISTVKDCRLKEMESSILEYSANVKDDIQTDDIRSVCPICRENRTQIYAAHINPVKVDNDESFRSNWLHRFSCFSCASETFTNCKDKCNICNGEIISLFRNP